VFGTGSFRRGATMRALATVQMLMDFSETSGRSDRGVAQVSPGASVPLSAHRH
jgi:hypothetical protein